MSVENQEIAPKTEVTEPSINDLKAAAYDEIAKIEEHQRGIQQCQQNIQKINEEIMKKKQEALRQSALRPFDHSTSSGQSHPSTAQDDSASTGSA